MSSFPSQPSKPDFWSLQQAVLEFWKQTKAFEQSIEMRPADQPFRFYDGPPFITGTPHYGTLLSSICKDVIPRYQTMKGKRVERVRGRDCHGLPIEQKVQAKLGRSTSKEIEEKGVDTFIQECYNYTKSVSDERPFYVDNIARRVDYDNAYKTMDNDYMESVMRVFSQLWEKGLVYKGKRVSMFSTALSTPISSFEVAMDDTYNDINDPAITVKFELTSGIHNLDEVNQSLLPDGYSLRYATIDDFEEATVMRKQAWIETYTNADHGIDEKTINDHFANRIKENRNIWESNLAKNRPIILATYNNKIVGIKFYQYQPKRENHYEYGGVYLLKEHQGKGLAQIIESHSLQGRSHVDLHLDVVAYNPRAIRYYEKQGFVQVPEKNHTHHLFGGQQFPLIHMIKKAEKKLYALARTTTPRTIPSNLGLAVSEDILYARVEYNDEHYILASKRVEKVFAGKEYHILEDGIAGLSLVGLSYKPPYDYFVGKDEANHRVYAADFVSDEDGTGIVHISPEFGELDFQLGKKEGLTQTEALDDEGRYTSQIRDKVGVFYRDANEPICLELKEKGLLFDKGSITHRVAFCPRSNTPLIFKAQDSRFVDIQSLKPRLLAANEQINRYPEHFKYGRFAKTLEQAPDRCISRTRFWGTPMPVYVPKDKKSSSIHFLRHGFTDKSLDDGDLTNEGIAQITALAQKMKTEGHPYTQILTSSMKRAIQTAEIVSEILDIPMKIDERFGSVERKKRLKIAKQEIISRLGLKDFSLFHSSDDHLLDVLGPNLAEDKQTIVDLRKHHKESTLVVSHGEIVSNFQYCINGGSITQTFGAMQDWGTIQEIPLYKPFAVLSSRDEIFHANKPYKQLTKIIFMRHGRTDYNEKHRGDAEGKGRLTDYGHEQAQAMAVKYGSTHVDAIYCSPLQRCQQTVGYLADSLGKDIIIDKRLTECQAFAIQDQVFDCSSITRGTNQPIDGVSGESIEDVAARVHAFLLEKIQKHAGETIVICSHGDPLVLMRKMLGDFDYNTEKKKRYINNKETMDTTVIEYVDVAHQKRLDLHRPVIDTIRVAIDGQEYQRIPEVLDVWMDSASMPYAQVHYPFANKETFEKQFPADYIVEYTGQIRAWFQVMHVIAVALFDKPSFTNVLCTGVMKGNDGRKMSKSYGNYPDPKKSLMQFGGDAIRMHSLLSTIVYGGDIEVKEEGFIEVTKTVLLPLRNAFNFFITYATIDQRTPDSLSLDDLSFMDRWIIGKLNVLIDEVDTQLGLYAMHHASRAVLGFLDDLTNRYIRRSRRRFWRSENDGDKNAAYSTLYTVLFTLTKGIAPLMPFLAEHMHRALGGEGSVHHQLFPVADMSLVYQSQIDQMSRVARLVSAGLGWRAKHTVRVRQPLASATISESFDDDLLDILKEELNVKQVSVDSSITTSVQTIVKPDGKIVGKRLGGAFKNVLEKAKNGEFIPGDDGQIIVDGHVLFPGEFSIDYRSQDEAFDGEIVDGMVVIMDSVLTKELEYEGYARDLIRTIQEARKTAGYDLTQRIAVYLEGSYPLMEVVDIFGELIREETLSEFGEIGAVDQEGKEMMGDAEVVWKIAKR